MQDTSEIVIITGYRVCKMDPPIGGGGVQLVCVCVCVCVCQHTGGREKVFMKVIYWASATAYLVYKNRLVHWYRLCMEVVSPRDMMLGITETYNCSPSEPCVCCELGECVQ